MSSQTDIILVNLAVRTLMKTSKTWCIENTPCLPVSITRISKNQSYLGAGKRCSTRSKLLGNGTTHVTCFADECASQIKRREKNPKLDPAPKLHLIGMGRSYDDDDDQRMAPGSWTKRVYNGEGKVVGYQRFEQFEQYDEDDFDGSPPPYVPPKDFQHLKMGSKWIERPSWIKMTKYGRYYAD